MGKIDKADLLAELKALLPEKKTLETDLDEYNIGGFEESHKFCVECGQYEFEGQLDCKCKGFNQAIDQIQKAIEEWAK